MLRLDLEVFTHPLFLTIIGPLDNHLFQFLQNSMHTKSANSIEDRKSNQVPFFLYIYFSIFETIEL